MDLKVRRDKLITQSAFAKKRGVTPQAVTRMVREGRVDVIQIEGAKLILLP